MKMSEHNTKIIYYTVAGLLGAALGTLPTVLSYANDTSVSSDTRTTTSSTSPGANAQANISSNTPGSYGSDSNGATSINTTISSTGKNPNDRD